MKHGSVQEGCMTLLFGTVAGSWVVASDGARYMLLPQHRMKFRDGDACEFELEPAPVATELASGTFSDFAVNLRRNQRPGVLPFST